MDLVPFLCLDLHSSSSNLASSPLPPTLRLHLLTLIPGCLPTCMRGVGRLQTVLLQVIFTLRQLADSLESALEEEQDEERGQRPRPSVAPSPQGAADRSSLPDFATASASVDPTPVSGASRFSASSAHDEVAQLLTTAPQYCFDLCNRLAGTREFVRFRVQRAWEAGLWAKAVVDGRITKPRPTPRLEVRSTVYIIVRGPGIQQPTRVSSSAAFFQLVPRFTEDSLSHSFPSICEATVYCLALGIDLPPEQ